MLTASVQRRIEDVNKVFNALGCNACVEVRKIMDDNGVNAVDTAIVIIDDNREYAAYASQISTAMSTYLCGLQHGLQLVAGNYPFKSLNTQARIQSRESILKTRQKRPTRERVDARTALRFKFQRNKYREE